MSPPKLSLCFVCLGNICRSPTAEGVMKHLVSAAGLSDRIVCDSAGTAAYHAGEPPDRRSSAAARRRGVTLTGPARQFVSEDFERFDYVLAMDAANFVELRRIARGCESKLHYLRDFDPDSAQGSSVPDPYYGGENGFAVVLDQCEAACRGLLLHLTREHRL